MNISGIYKIENLENGKIYVGQSIDIGKRWRKHKLDLKNNKHHNSHLQYSWNKYGENNFEFKMLELVDDVSNLDNKEKFWMNELNTCDVKHGYNLTDEKGIGFSAKSKINTEKYILINRDMVNIDNYKELDKHEKLVYFVLRDFIVGSDNCVMVNGEVPTIEQMKDIVGLSKTVFINALNSLEEKKIDY